MSTDGLIWLIYAALVALVVVAVAGWWVASKVSDWWNLRPAKRRKRAAEFDAYCEHRARMRALTQDDREWLVSMGWKP